MNGALHSEHVISRSGIAVSPESENEDDHSLLFGALASRFFQPQDVARKRCFINARRKPVPTVTCWECTPAIHSIQFFCENFLTKSVAQDLHGPASLWRIRNTHLTQTADFPPAHALLAIFRSMSRLFHKGPAFD